MPSLLLLPALDSIYSRRNKNFSVFDLLPPHLKRLKLRPLSHGHLLVRQTIHSPRVKKSTKDILFQVIALRDWNWSEEKPIWLRSFQIVQVMAQITISKHFPSLHIYIRALERASFIPSLESMPAPFSSNERWRSSTRKPQNTEQKESDKRKVTGRQEFRRQAQ